MKLKSALLGALCVFAIVPGAAQAASLLYRNDYTVGTDYLGQAIGASSYAVTSTSGDLSGFNLSDYNVVVYANQDYGIPGNDLAQLNAYIAAGGEVIFDDWTQSNGFNGGQTFTGNINQTSLTVGSQFSAGIVNPLDVTNTGWGIFSTGLAANGGVVAGTFGDGEAGIIVGNGGKTIVNGFLSDTVASQQLYTNELGSLSAVPETSTWLMMLAGFAGLGFLGARRNKAATLAV
jgi:hypothetical protein